MCLISYCQSVRQLMNESLSESLLQSVGQCPLTFLYLFSSFSSSPLLLFSPPPLPPSLLPSSLPPLPPSPSPLPLLPSSSSLLSSPPLISSYSHLPPYPPPPPFPPILLISSLLLFSSPLLLLSSPSPLLLSSRLFFIFHQTFNSYGLRHVAPLYAAHELPQGLYMSPLWIDSDSYSLPASNYWCELPLTISHEWHGTLYFQVLFLWTVCVIKLNTKYDGIKFSREYFFPCWKQFQICKTVIAPWIFYSTSIQSYFSFWLFEFVNIYSGYSLEYFV